ncbi:Glycerol kinase [Anaerovibrio sp. JC8]|uniref:FGGY-family carbohydrate kinase n=1 Tax=Anaerovibrio sp. JC8 TaxID=1240085 RepID=UPI000A0AC586|nr:glycerol kinase [Anaerovibrio sp. JC8]ORU00181.1 Glycerol kinase [Anaerovibrio sp. JC8]
MAKYILGIDQSTQGTKVLLFDNEGKAICRVDKGHRQIIDDRGWVEHDPMEIWHNLLEITKELLAETKVDSKDIAAVGISNQRETAMAWNRENGEPIYNAIVWQCARGAAICQRLDHDGFGDRVKDHTGIPLSPYFSGAKLAWIVENVGEAKSLLAADKLAVGTMDSWLVYKLTGGKAHKTDFSNASRTQLFNINTLKWDEEICNAFGLKASALPEVCDSNALYGTTDFEGLFEKPVPIHGVFGDSHAALYGQGCHTPGMIKATYGTGSSVMMNIGEKPIQSKKGLVTSLAWSLDGKPEYVLEGNINYTGASISWLKDNVELIESAKETAELAKKSNPADKTYFVPAFSGLGAPYWDSEATGMFTGITRVTGKAELVRAVVDSIAYQISDIAELMEEESGKELQGLRVDGGPTRNDYLMQFQADILDRPVEVPDVEELSAIGAAYAAGISAGIYENKKVFGSISRISYVSGMGQDRRDQLKSGWKSSIRRTLART